MTRPRSPHPLRTAAVLALVALLATACGDDSADGDGGTTTSSSSSTTSTEPPGSTTSSSSTTTTEVPSTTAPSSTIPDNELPGEPFDVAPAAGRTLLVVGVAFDDVLNVRRAPGTDQQIVAELPPLADDFVATGRARQLPASIWFEVTTADSTVGWVSSRFTAAEGPTGDVTSRVVDTLGEIPEEETMDDLGRLVAETLRTDPEIPSDIVKSVTATVGDLGEVTYDLVGIGDDSVAGYRLHVFGQPLDSGEGFGLKSVESTDLCQPHRGPAEPGGICS